MTFLIMSLTRATVARSSGQVNQMLSRSSATILTGDSSDRQSLCSSRRVILNTEGKGWWTATRPSRWMRPHHRIDLSLL